PIAIDHRQRSRVRHRELLHRVGHGAHREHPAEPREQACARERAEHAPPAGQAQAGQAQERHCRATTSKVRSAVRPFTSGSYIFCAEAEGTTKRPTLVARARYSKLPGRAGSQSTKALTRESLRSRWVSQSRPYQSRSSGGRL